MDDRGQDAIFEALRGQTERELDRSQPKHVVKRSARKKAETFQNELLERLNTFRNNRELCDVVLFVREREIFAHKVVLAAVSPALYDMFLKEDEEQNTNGSGIINKLEK